MSTEFLRTLDQRSRWGLAAGAGVIAAVAIAAAAWLLRTDYQVLFADLKPQDAAQMTAELERQKITYRVSDDGSAILVDAAVVHATRLKLMGKDMPLHGAAGFELFNNGDFGMTEFAQKVNYQRALQGELTRTILALSEVRDARVHLALPEDGLFKRSNNKPKAAITLALKAGQALRADQVNGIQRLVAGAVPGILAQDVTIVDQQGIALTRIVPAEGEAQAGSGRLDLKRDMERLLARKATDVLERAFGAGQAMATVDVTLNMDQVRVTTEDVIGTPGQAGQAPSGVMVRQREVLRDVGAPLGGQQEAANHASNTQREIEYQVGRRVEQVVTQPGTIRRLHVAAVVRNPLDAQQLEQARALLTAAVGGVSERGDTIVVQSLKAFDAVNEQNGAILPAPAASEHIAVKRTHENTIMAKSPIGVGIALAGAAALLLAGMLFAGRRRLSRQRALIAAPLSEAERQALVAQLKLWLDQSRLPDSRVPAVAAKGLSEAQP